MKTPKYDNDLVPLWYLKERLNSGDTIEQIMQSLPQSYSSPPTPPYHKGSTLFYNNKLYRCKIDRVQGLFNWNDWEVIATDDTGLNDFIENTYSVDKIQIQEQLDEKIQTYYQENDPNVWTTDLEKSKHVGDYWYRTADNTQWRFSRITTNPITYGWQQVNVPNAIFDLIDTKKSIYTSKPTSYKKDDLWIIEETISDEDLPVGTEENPITRGDWVFSTVNSEIYNKAHWVKRDENIDIEYIEEHYYNKGQTDTKFEEVERNTDSKITKAKDEIKLEVEQTYTSKEEHTTAINDFNTQIGSINETITTQGNNLSQLSVETGEISSVVSSMETITNEKFIEINGQIEEVSSKTSTIENSVTQLQTDTYTKTEINTKLTDGSVKKILTTTLVVDENGLIVDKGDNSKVKSNMDADGFKVIDKTGAEEKVILDAGYDSETGETRVMVDRIKVNSIKVGSYSQLEDYIDENGREGLGIFI